MLLQGGETENLEDSDDLSPQQSMGHSRKPIQNQGLGANHFQGLNSWNLEGRAMSALSSFGQNARMVSEPTWLRRVQQQQAILEPPGNWLFQLNKNLLLLMMTPSFSNMLASLHYYS